MIVYRYGRLAVLGAALAAAPLESAYFTPSHLVPGIGVDRQGMQAEILAERTDAMVQSQTFSIMREPQAGPGAERITSPAMQRLFREAEHKTGFPASTLQAIAYLESWGIANAESPAGPRGIMQISEATGKRMGLRIIYATRRRTIKTKIEVRNKHGKLVTRTVKSKQTYAVLVRDDRLNPDRAIPAAAAYLAGLEKRYGGRDWAIWAYHCGEGCVADFMSQARGIKGLDDPPASVAKVFFGCSPVWNRDLCAAIHTQMERDYSPTYWFRVARAEQLLRMYQDDPPEFRDLAEAYKYRDVPAQRAPDRLSAWLRPEDLVYETPDAIRNDTGRLVTAPSEPDFFGYRLDPAAAPEALPSAIGTLAYIAFETRRLYAAMLPDAPFYPLDVTALVAPKDQRPVRGAEHSSGQVFDVSLAGLPGGERDCLQFVLDDLGWNGYLGFVDEPQARETVHIGCSPSSRTFFTQVFEEELAAWRERTAPPVTPVETPSAVH